MTIEDIRSQRSCRLHQVRYPEQDICPKCAEAQDLGAGVFGKPGAVPEVYVNGSNGVQVVSFEAAVPQSYLDWIETAPPSLTALRVPAGGDGFPLEALDANWRRYTESLSLLAGMTPERSFTALAGGAAAALAPLVDAEPAQIGGLQGPLGLFTFDLSPSGGRKSELERYIRHPHADADKELGRSFRVRKADLIRRFGDGDDGGGGGGRGKKKSSRGAAWLEKNDNPRLLQRRTTPQGVFRQLEFRRGSYLLNADAASMLSGGWSGSKGVLTSLASSYADLYSTGCLQDATTSTDGGRGHDYNVDRARISITLGMQLRPGLAFIHNPDVVAVGFPARCLMVIDGSEWEPAPELGPETERQCRADLEEYGGRVREMRHIADMDWLYGLPEEAFEEAREPQLSALRAGPEVKSIFGAFYRGDWLKSRIREAEMTGDELTTSWLKRAGEHALRLAALFSGWDAAESEGMRRQSGGRAPDLEITAADMRAGIVLTRWYAGELDRVVEAGSTVVQKAMETAVGQMRRILSGEINPGTKSQPRGCDWDPAVKRIGFSSVTNTVVPLRNNDELRKRVFETLVAEGHIWDAGGRTYCLHPAHMGGA